MALKHGIANNGKDCLLLKKKSDEHDILINELADDINSLKGDNLWATNKIKELGIQLIEAREAAIDLYHIHAFSDKRAAEVYIRVKKLIRKWEEDAESKSF